MLKLLVNCFQNALEGSISKSCRMQFFKVFFVVIAFKAWKKYLKWVVEQIQPRWGVLELLLNCIQEVLGGTAS